MKKMYKFLFYKLYRFSVAEEKSVSLNFGFICLATGFQILHFLIIGLLSKILFVIDLNLNPKLFSLLFLAIGVLLNYLFFIKNKRIKKINIYFQSQKRIVWRDNLVFFGYIILLFFIMFFQVFLLKKF